MKSSANEFGDILYSVANEREDFVVYCPDTRSCGLEYFKDKFPGRGFNFGIAEQNLLDAAAGAASTGLKVYVPTFAVFMSMRACEQIRQFICYPKQDVTLLSTHTGLQVGSDGGTHIAVEDVGIMRSIPNMSIVQPADGHAARAIAKFSLDFHQPLYVRLHREAVPEVYDDSYEFEFNKIRIVKEYGHDLAILATGVMVGKALEAAEELADKGINAIVADVSTIKPIDVDGIVNIASKTSLIVTVEDHNVIGGLSSAVAEVLCREMPTKMCSLGIPDCFGESGKSAELYELHHLNAESIADTIKNIVKNQ